MKRLLAVLCLLGALGASSQNVDTCRDSAPPSCQFICYQLQGALEQPNLPPAVVEWLLNTRDSNDCLMDAACYSVDEAQCYRAAVQLFRYLSSPGCRPDPARCLTADALALMDDPTVWTRWGAL